MTSSIPPSSALPIPPSPSGHHGSHGSSTPAPSSIPASATVTAPSAVSATNALAPIVQAMQTALADTVNLSSQAQQAIKLEAFTRMVQQLISQIQPPQVELPASWPVGGTSQPMQQLLTLLLQQLTAQQPLPQQLVSAQPWPATLAQAVLQHTQAQPTLPQSSASAAVPAPASPPPASMPVAATPPTTPVPAQTTAPMPLLQNWLVQQGTVMAQDGERAFTLTLRVPAAWAQAQTTLAAALPTPAGATASTATAAGAAALPAALQLPFAGSVQQLASGSFGLVMQPQVLPNSATAATAQAMRTSALLQLEFQPLAQAAPAAALYMPGHISQQDVQAMLQGRGTDPWLLMAQAQADGTNQPKQRKNGNEQAGLCNRAGCQYQGRAACAQPFCAEMNYLWSVDRAQRSAGL